MEYRNFTVILKDMWRLRVRIFIFAIVMLILCAGYGYYKANKQAAEVTAVEEDETYSQFMEEYKASYEEAKAATDEAIKVRDEEQKYVDNSIYMQLDSSKIHVANTQYSVSSNLAANYNANIVNVYNSYIKEGGFIKALAEDYAASDPKMEVNEEYFKELVTVTPANPYFSISVMCVDQDMAESIIPSIDKVIQGYKAKVEEAAASPFMLTQISVDTTVKTDPAVLNAQNSHINNLKNYDNAVRDQRQAQANIIRTMADYRDDNMPEVVNYESPKKAALKWAIYGLILGIILPFAFLCLRYLLGSKLKNPDDITASGMTVIFRYLKGKGYTSELKRALVGMEFTAAGKETGEICIWALSETEEAKKAVEELKKVLSEADCKLKVGDTVFGNSADINDAREVINKKNVIVLVETGVTEYKDIEEQKYLLTSAGVDIWGCLAVC